MLTAKVAERRMTSILAVAAVAVATVDAEAIVPPSSPEPRRPKARAAVAIEQAKSMLSYGMRPSWVTNIASVNAPKPAPFVAGNDANLNIDGNRSDLLVDSTVSYQSVCVILEDSMQASCEPEGT